MIQVLILLSLPALAPTQDDPAAREALQKIEETLAKAKTVTLRSRTEAKALGATAVITATALFKGSRAILSGTQKTDQMEQRFASLVEDGKLHVQFDGRNEGTFDLPKEYLADLQSVLVRTGVFPIAALTHPKIAGDRIRTPGKIIDVSDLKLADDARTLSYKLAFHEIRTLNPIGGVFHCTLGFDPASGRMTKRTMTASAADGRQIVITETYDLTLDAEIPDALFKFPERAPLMPGGFKPTECHSNQCSVDLTDAKEGRWVTYLMKSGPTETRYTPRIVGKIEGDWMIETWFDTGSLKYALLYRVGAEGRILKAWAAAEGDPAWTSILVKDPPKPVNVDAPKPVTRESEEKKQVQAGAFDCKRVDVTLKIAGREYKSSSWYSKDAWKFLPGKDQPGGLVAMEASGMSTVLEARGEDAKPTIPLPKE